MFQWSKNRFEIHVNGRIVDGLTKVNEYEGIVAFAAFFFSERRLYKT